MTLKLVIRNLRKRPFLNLIKVTGLSLALSSILLIVLFLKNELTFDRFHSRADDIHRFTTTSPTFFSGKHFARVYRPVYVPEMAETFSGIEEFVRLAPVAGGVMKLDDRYININQAFQCDSTFFRVFDVEMVAGNPGHVLDGPASMVVTESFARKVFGDEDPIGRVLSIPPGQYYGEELVFTINGIMKDFPPSSHFHPDFITTPADRSYLEFWAWTYLLFEKKADPGQLISGFREFYSSVTGNNTGEQDISAHLQPIGEIHLRSEKTREIEPNSNMNVVYSFTAAALLMLFIALINFANLNIGMAGYNDKYVFMSRVLGTSRWTELKYLLADSVVLLLISLTLSGMITAYGLIYIRRNLALDLLGGNIYLIFSIAILFFLLGLLAGQFPVIRQLATGKRSSLDMRSSGIVARRGISKGLIVVQFAISIALIAAVLVINRQTKFALESSLGVENRDIICFENVHSGIQDRFTGFKKELLKYPSILSVSGMLDQPGGESNDMFRFTMEGFVADDTEESDDMIGIFPCDYSFATIFGLEFLAGTNFSERFEDNEGSGEYLINESAMRRLNYTNPEEIVGKDFSLFFGGEGITIPSGRIVGVVEDFHLSSLKREVEAQVLFKRKGLWLRNILVSFSPQVRERALADMEGVWEKMFPEYLLRFDYVDTMYRNLYSTELLQIRLLSIFTVIALFICSMGLLGLSLLTTQRRVREIGIRKVNGAREWQIMSMLNRDFLKWILVSAAIAIPFVYLAMNRWMESFAYRTALSWWIFALAGFAGLVVALLTVTLTSWRASNTNPVDALRYE